MENKKDKPNLIEFAGILSDNEARIMKNEIVKGRKKSFRRMK